MSPMNVDVHRKLLSQGWANLDADFSNVARKNKLFYGVSDLHLLMALVQVNEGSRDVSTY